MKILMLLLVLAGSLTGCAMSRETPLITAVGTGDIAAVEALLVDDAATTPADRTRALGAAVYAREAPDVAADIVRRLIEAGVRPDEPVTLIFHAYAPEVADALLEAPFTAVELDDMLLALNLWHATRLVQDGPWWWQAGHGTPMYDPATFHPEVGRRMEVLRARGAGQSGRSLRSIAAGSRRGGWFGHPVVWSELDGEPENRLAVISPQGHVVVLDQELRLVSVGALSHTAGFPKPSRGDGEEMILFRTDDPRLPDHVRGRWQLAKPWRDTDVWPPEMDLVTARRIGFRKPHFVLKAASPESQPPSALRGPIYVHPDPPPSYDAGGRRVTHLVQPLIWFHPKEAVDWNRLPIRLDELEAVHFREVEPVSWGD